MTIKNACQGYSTNEGVTTVYNVTPGPTNARSITAVFANGDTHTFRISNGVDFEIFQGDYSAAGPTITVLDLYYSSNGDAPVVWGPGQKLVEATALAEELTAPPTPEAIVAAFGGLVPLATDDEAIDGVEDAPRQFSPQRVRQSAMALKPHLPAKGPIYFEYFGQSDLVAAHTPPYAPGTFTINPMVFDLQTPNAAAPTTYSFVVADPGRASGYVVNSIMTGMVGGHRAHSAWIAADIIQRATGQPVYMNGTAQNSQPIASFLAGGPVNAVINARRVDALADPVLMAAGITGPHFRFWHQGNGDHGTGRTPEQYGADFLTLMAYAEAHWGGPAPWFIAPISPLATAPLPTYQSTIANWDGHQVVNSLTDESVTVMSGADMELMGDVVHLTGDSIIKIGRMLAKLVLAGPAPKTGYSLARFRALCKGSGHRVVQVDPNGNPTAKIHVPANQNLLINPHFDVWQYSPVRAGGSAGYFADSWFVESTDTLVAAVNTAFYGRQAQFTFGASGQVIIGKPIELAAVGQSAPLFVGDYFFSSFCSDRDFVNRTYEVKLAYRDSAISAVNESVIVNWTPITSPASPLIPMDSFILEKALPHAFLAPLSTNKCCVVLLRISGVAGGPSVVGQTTTHKSFKLEVGTSRSAGDYIPIGQVLPQCQRYYHTEQVPMQRFSSHAVNALHSWAFRFPRTMYKAPTTSMSLTNVVYTRCSGLTLRDATKNQVSLEVTATAADISCFWTTTAFDVITLDANL